MERGLRAKTGVVDDASNMTKEEMDKVLEKYVQNKFDKLTNK